MLKPRPIFRGKYSTFQLRTHYIPIYSIYAKIRNNSVKGVCQIIRGAEFLTEIQYIPPLGVYLPLI